MKSSSAKSIAVDEQKRKHLVGEREVVEGTVEDIVHHAAAAERLLSAACEGHGQV